MDEHNLLVIDWDYFFPQPRDGGDVADDPFGLYDWQHAETRFMVEMVWDTRAAGFLTFDQELPRCQGYAGFWDRFTIRSGASLAFADSNTYAALMRPDHAHVWDSVWLFDAHHDCGYRGESLAQWRTRDYISCEDWMLVHADRGSELHVRYPPWKVRGPAIEPPPPVAVDRQLDNGKPLAVEFDAVFLCRSGAWVPPWCDDQFADFLAAFPGPTVNVDQRYDSMGRTFDPSIAETMSSQAKQLLRLTHSTITHRDNGVA